MESFPKAKFWSVFNHLLLYCAHYMYTNTDSSYPIASLWQIEWSAVHYDISLQWTSLQWHIVAIIISLCEISLQEVSLERYLGKKSRRLYRYLAVLSLKCSAIHAMFRWYIANKLREQSAIFVNYRLHYFCTVLYFWRRRSLEKAYFFVFACSK